MDDTPGSHELFLFLASTAHDMKNSISVLSGTLEALLDGRLAERSAPAYPQMAHMLYQTKRLNDNLMQLLALYKQVGKPDIRSTCSRWRSATWCAGGVGRAHPAQSRGIVLETDFDPRPDLALRRRPDHRRAGPRDQQRHQLHRATASGWRSPPSTAASKLRVEDNGAGYPAGDAGGGRLGHERRSAAASISSPTAPASACTFPAKWRRCTSTAQRSGALRLENGGAYGGGCFILTLP